MNRIRTFALVAIAACIPVGAEANSGLMDCAVRSECSSLIGKQIWVNIPRSNPNTVEVTFSKGDWGHSLKLRSGSFLITGIDGDDFSVRLPDGRRGWTGKSSAIFFATYDPVQIAKDAKSECDRRGQPKIGMTPSELTESCWGRPRRIVKRTTAAGVEESYVYSVGHIVRFTDGKISEIVEAR